MEDCQLDVGRPELERFQNDCCQPFGSINATSKWQPVFTQSENGPGWSG
jgi:hypothetical protein